MREPTTRRAILSGRGHRSLKGSSTSSTHLLNPHTCGKVERFHQTLKRFLKKQRPARSLAELQHQLDIFRAYYNNVRPHRALNRQTPMAVFNALIKAKPLNQPAPVDHRVRHDKSIASAGSPCATSAGSGTFASVPCTRTGRSTF